MSLFSDLEDNIFIGKKIRLAFPAVHPDSGKPLLEFMKVVVSHKKVTNNINELVGLLLEESNYNSDYKLGDMVAFHKSEITEMCAEGVC